MANFTGQEVGVDLDPGASPTGSGQEMAPDIDNAAFASAAAVEVPVDIFNAQNEGSAGRLAYINRVRDAVAGADVVWVTFNSPDHLVGLFYPGPGSFGQDTSDATIDDIIEANRI